MNRHQAALRGWSNSGVIVRHPDLARSLPPRQNARWNDREDYDLCEAFTKGATITNLAKRHGRARTAILMRVERCLEGATRYMEGGAAN
ncbi:hypothetical protein WK13_34580 [Burkholderia ubonensis]|uniref:hypothetical protein n=1 Tax=Burkholderia ubonensis TaxID=101571 RepID=UPI0007554087|nr:hypothetical protein [Burkholderia ubonensis]KVR21666.1 hypothetical protein WK13_34580 [Burkholderia ubonensis]